MYKLSKIFWPNSSDHSREIKVICVQFRAALANNFSAINHLSEFLNSYVPNANFHSILLDPSKSLSENARALMSKAHQINLFLTDLIFHDSCKISSASVDIGSERAIMLVGELASKNSIQILTSRTAQFAASLLAVAIPTDLSEITAETIINTILVAGKSNNADDGVVELKVMVEGYTAESVEFFNTVHEVRAAMRVWNKYHASQ